MGALDVILPETSLQPTQNIDGATVTDLGNDQTEVNFGDEGSSDVPPQDSQEHYANLAEFLTEGELSNIAQDVEEMFKSDLASRAPWYERLAKGLELIGVIDEKDSKPPFKGASTVVHPLVAEAIVQYQARALAELYPATGPAKATVLGNKTREKEAQAERVADFLNYQLTFDDRTYFAESDRALFLQASDGSVFRKVYRDFLIGKNVSRLVKAEHFIVPYNATSLEDAPRYTHLLHHTQNEMKRLQKMGFYRDTALAIPAGRDEEAENSALTEARDEQEGRTDPDTRPEDREHIVREMVVDYDLPRFEDREPDPKTGELTETGIALPYVIAVERDSLKVLSIRRGWRENDQPKRRRIQFTHYPFIRGDGFYGFGLIHLAGGLGRAATGTLRVILDNAAFAALQGGFRTRQNKLSGDVTLEHGVWKETDMDYDDLSKSFYTPPWKEVPNSLFNVLGLLTDLGQRYVNTTDATVGDAKNTGPVGTTVALIEQGQKVATGIHKRSHDALGQELRQLAELNGEHLPPEGYPYDVPGASKQIFREDFGPAVDVEPVSDPNIFSNTQRIAQGQAVMQLAETAPDLYDRREAHRRMLDSMKVPDVDALLPPPAQIKRCDPVTENAKAMTGEPIKVFPDQAHDAHIAVHMGQLQMLNAQGAASLQTAQQLLVPHIQDHEAQSMRLKFATDMGIQLPPLEAQDPEGQPLPEMPPQVENMIATKAAAIMKQLTAQLKQSQDQADGQPMQDEHAQSQQDMAHKEQDHAAEQKRKDDALIADEKRKDFKLQNDMQRQDAQAGIDPTAVKSAAKYLAERGLDRVISPKKLAATSAALGKGFDDVVKMIMWFSQGGQGQGPSPYARPTLGGQPQ